MRALEVMVHAAVLLPVGPRYHPASRLASVANSPVGAMGLCPSAALSALVRMECRTLVYQECGRALRPYACHAACVCLCVPCEGGMQRWRMALTLAQAHERPMSSCCPALRMMEAKCCWCWARGCLQPLRRQAADSDPAPHVAACRCCACGTRTCQSQRRRDAPLAATLLLARDPSGPPRCPPTAPLLAPAQGCCSLNQASAVRHGRSLLLQVPLVLRLPARTGRWSLLPGCRCRTLSRQCVACGAARCWLHLAAGSSCTA